MRVCCEFDVRSQREFGKCFADWMVNGGFCDTTCGRCSCPGSPAPPELEIDASGKECICSDQPPPCSDFPCEQQVFRIGATIIGEYCNSLRIPYFCCILFAAKLFCAVHSSNSNVFVDLQELEIFLLMA